MPYKSVDELPDNIKKLSAKKQRQWMDIWNSAYSRCTSGGKDAKTCESSAFAQANGVVLSGKSSNSAAFAGGLATFELEKAAVPLFDDGEMVYRGGKLFVAGDYPDKAYAMTAEELAEAAEAFSEPLAIDLEHVPTPLDGKLGELVSVEARGNELHGIVALPKWLDGALDERKVSATWDRATKTLAGLALVRNPRVSDAALMAAFAIDEAVHDSAALDALQALFADGRHSTPEGQMALQEMHDIAARRGAVCKASNTRQPAKMASSHEATALQKIHDLTIDHGSKCSSSVYPPNGFPFFSAARQQHATRKEGRRMSRFDEFMAWLKGDEGSGDPPAAGTSAAATMSSGESAEMKALRERQTALEAENRRIRLERIQDQAVTFADTQIRELRAFPAERESIISDYVQRATDDLVLEPTTVTFKDAEGKEQTKKASRVDMLTAAFAARPKHGLTAEQMTERGLVALTNGVETDANGKDKPASKERVEKLIGMTPLGQAHLRARNGNGSGA